MFAQRACGQKAGGVCGVGYPLAKRRADNGLASDEVKTAAGSGPGG
ncbi:MAG: hypothetical protein H0Z24_10165 [Thermosipho sp. (in: Bacteria)]|nr:hypothetical protein [Thermosipho sp. (in: thermotogales)]